MIQVARLEGLNVEQNAAEILVEQVRFTLLLAVTLPCHALAYLTLSFPSALL